MMEDAGACLSDSKCGVDLLQQRSVCMTFLCVISFLLFRKLKLFYLLLVIIINILKGKLFPFFPSFSTTNEWIKEEKIKYMNSESFNLNLFILILIKRKMQKKWKSSITVKWIHSISSSFFPLNSLVFLTFIIIIIIIIWD